LEAVRAQVDLEPFTDAAPLAVAALYLQVSGRDLSLTADHLWIGLSLDIAVPPIRPARG
jgi:hypothetical protein